MEEEEEVETSELSADNQEEKALDVSSTSSAEQEVSIPALLAVIGRKVPETSQSQEEVGPHSILSLLFGTETLHFYVRKYTENDYWTDYG